MNNNFSFKRFSLNNTDHGMKICTDNVLFGAWINITGFDTILDIGTGLGLLSLILAQRSTIAKIIAIEINEKASLIAKNNFLNSPWKNRLSLINISLEKFAKITSTQFNLIVSNPPWFNYQKPASLDKQLARYKNALSNETLIINVKNLLAKSGEFAVMLPYTEKNTFINEALIAGLYLKKETIVFTKKHNAKRAFLSFCFLRPKNIEKNNIIIYNDKNEYSEQYKLMVKDFYLNF
ncbi:MAG TPA: methyltransferase [Bacteroidales bacterium]|nr:methyltransferase [Bacteroidales bacterium]